jgi:hypothetical protein
MLFNLTKIEDQRNNNIMFENSNICGTIESAVVVKQLLIETSFMSSTNNTYELSRTSSVEYGQSNIYEEAANDYYLRPFNSFLNASSSALFD